MTVALAEPFAVYAQIRKTRNSAADSSCA